MVLLWHRKAWRLVLYRSFRDRAGSRNSCLKETNLKFTEWFEASFFLLKFLLIWFNQIIKLLKYITKNLSQSSYSDSSTIALNAFKSRQGENSRPGLVTRTWKLWKLSSQPCRSHSHEKKENKKMPCSRRGSNPRPSHCFSTLGGYMAGTAYKYDALTDCATGARRKRPYCSFDVFMIVLTLNRFLANRKWAPCTLRPWFWTNSWANRLFKSKDT